MAGAVMILSAGPLRKLSNNVTLSAAISGNMSIIFIPLISTID